MRAGRPARVSHVRAIAYLPASWRRALVERFGGVRQAHAVQPRGWPPRPRGEGARKLETRSTKSETMLPRSPVTFLDQTDGFFGFPFGFRDSDFEFPALPQAVRGSGRYGLLRGVYHTFWRCQVHRCIISSATLQPPEVRGAHRVLASTELASVER
jgi:hypothetical protein